ncbi:MAG: tRNA (adenosine(37)-N6)-threonylcarbamoyltransferase complex ATPase subunit type 1 TsaE [Woeseiaceae bacterium]|nr:tRNA (adenosine(37)-N6)-threonylcarbamoyltransferase complex ATPase subunit type 1 TsaE [Woeseiaceae bacterium]
MIVERSLPDEASTAALGRELAASLPEDANGLLVALEGELGAGKTTLVRALLQSLGYRGPVPSPTYTLVEPYDVSGTGIHHVDLYRIGDAAELEFLGWSDIRQGLVLVEWPDRAPELTAEADLVIRLGYADRGRRARLDGRSAPGAAWIARLDGRG